MNRNKFKAGTAFQDMLFLMLSGVTVLWVLSFLLINPIAKTNDIISPAEYIITMAWASDSDDDLDLWLRTPNGAIIAFFNKDQDGSNLDRDDLGLNNDCYRVSSNSNLLVKRCVQVNREVLTLRGLIPGEYQLKFVVYNITGKVEGNPVDIEIVKVNPYSIQYKAQLNYEFHKQTISIIRFTINEDGDIIEWSEVPASFDRKKIEHTPGVADHNGGYRL